MRLDELPAADRRAVLAARRFGAQPGRRARPDTLQSDPRASTSPDTAARYRCATCGATFRPWAAAERHADTHGGARLELLRLT